MSNTFGFRPLCGKGSCTGHIRMADGLVHIACRGLPPGTRCQLFRENSRQETKTVSAAGTVSFTCTADGFFFVLGEEGRLYLWEGGANSTQNYYRALTLSPKQAAAPAPQPPAPASPLPQSQPAKAPPDPQKEALPLLRPPSQEPPAFTLPILQWPQSVRHLQPAFLSGIPCRPFSAPGFRCVRLPAGPGLPYRVLGYRTENSHVTALLYALPGRPALPPSGFHAGQYREGHFIRTAALPAP